MPLELHEQILHLLYLRKDERKSIELFTEFPNTAKNVMLRQAKDLEKRGFVNLRIAAQLNRNSIIDKLPSKKNTLRDFIEARITTFGIDYVTEKILPKIKPLTFKEKKYKLLKGLYDVRFKYDRYRLDAILNDVDIQEINEIAKVLVSEGKIEMVGTGLEAKILGPGIQAVEEMMEEEQSPSSHKIKDEDIEILKQKIDELAEQLAKHMEMSNLSHELTYDYIYKEFEEAKGLIKVIGKENLGTYL
ncbi:MAG TPA: hypothetical protein VGA67_04855, partial [Candidatus Dojkabacteria bacterium]